MTSAPLLPQAVQRHAAKDSTGLALQWLEGDRDEPVRSLSYGELDRQARRIAHALQTENLSGQRVFLPFPPGLDFVVAFLGCLYAGAIPAAAPFPQNRRTLARARAIYRDCQPGLGIAPQTWLGSVRERLNDGAGLSCPWASFEELLASGEAGKSLPPAQPDQLAYLQYTSGSGGAAKGVRITHSNLRHNISALQAGMHHPPSLPFVSWLPHFHDMQLAVVLARSLMLGSCAVLMSPVDFLQRPIRWLRALSRTGAYTSGGPNFAYEHCVRRIAPADVAGLDLSRWKIAFNSSERVRPATLERFSALVAGCGFQSESWYPGYGLAEATGFVTGIPVAEPPSFQPHPVTGRITVSCGRPAAGDRVDIVDPATASLCRTGQIGEICVAGGSVTPGYWNRREADAALLHHEVLGVLPSSGPWLRTGDLGFTDVDGNLFFAGRIKDLLIIRGVKHHPEDIEASLDGCHPALRAGELAVFALDDETESREHLVVMTELGRTHRSAPAVEEIAEAIQTIINREHELVLDRLVLLPPGGLPKTTSGKMQRSSCRELLLSGALAPIADWRRPSSRGEPSATPAQPTVPAPSP